jgi:GNAT superfamily N-acetyltransferase
VRVLEVFHTRQFTEEIDRLRAVSFSGQYPTGASRDSFDEKSYYVLVRIDGELAVGARLTPEPLGFYASCLSDSTAIAKESDAVDFNRVHVAPQYRGQGYGLVELIMLDGLLTCSALRFHWINGARPPRKRKAFFHALGFVEVGPVVQFRNESGYTEPEQLMLLEVSRTLCASWMRRKESVIGRLQERGFQIEDNGGHTQAIKDVGL